MGYTTRAAVLDSFRSETTPPSTPAIETSITVWSSFVDLICRQWFEDRECTFYFSGDGTDTVFLPVPIISITSLYVNSDFVNAVDADAYVAFTSRTVPDDRRNPKLRLIGSQNLYYPYTQESNPTYSIGSNNIKVIGHFGFLEDDDSTPPLIELATRKLVIRDLRSQSGGSAAQMGTTSPLGALSSITVDRNSERYSTPSFTNMRPGNIAVTGDPAIDDILAQYRAPILLGVSGTLETK